MALTFDDLKSGDVIRITFGSRASQVAVVHDRTRAGNVRVWKFSAKRSVWKGPMRIGVNDLIGPATLRNTAPLPVGAPSAR